MAMSAAATLARALRGGRRYGAGPNLVLPQTMGIGRRAPLERAAGPLLPRLGAAGGVARRLLYSKVQAGQCTTSQLVFNRTCTSKSEKDFLELVKDLAEAVETHRQENQFFQTIAVVFVGGLAASITALIMKVDRNDHENSLLRAELDKCKAKADALAAEVETLSAQLPRTATSTNNNDDITTPAVEHEKDSRALSAGTYHPRATARINSRVLRDSTKSKVSSVRGRH